MLRLSYTYILACDVSDLQHLQLNQDGGGPAEPGSTYSLLGSLCGWSSVSPCALWQVIGAATISVEIHVRNGCRYLNVIL